MNDLNTQEEKDELTVVFATRETDYEKESDFFEMLYKTAGCNIALSMLSNPDGLPLSQIYQDTLDENIGDTDIVVFIHDDIEFLREGWAKEIVRLFKENPEYGIIGVAGSADFGKKGAWWNYEKKYGQVLHRHDGKSWLTAFSPLLNKDLQEVAVIDGLFMAVNKKVAKAKFPQIGYFHFYDIGFCLANLTAKNSKCKIGVTTNIRVAHNSTGNVDDSWYAAREEINKRFGKYFPIDVEKNDNE